MVEKKDKRSQKVRDIEKNIDEYMGMYNSGDSLEVISQRMDVHYDTCRLIMKRAGLELRSNEESVILLHKAGKSIRQIAGTVRIPMEDVAKILGADQEIGRSKTAGKNFNYNAPRKFTDSDINFEEEIKTRKYK